ncbi:MAG TPA: dTDP-4-dehydrorhamnose 3,5-epimerase family protein [Stellaceae bacterium]|nr:dTDP-4-dehydrorhamnose 3,5-epimerase family protein [Stellaceae bacterium]
MIFEATPIAGAVIVRTDPTSDERGAFARVFCTREFATAGLNTAWPQWSMSSNDRRGTLRGLHYSVDPAPEIKLVWVARGAAFDVIVDVRRHSPSFRQWFGVELAAGAGRALYIPAGVAHGFQTLVDHTDVIYHISEFYDPHAARGVRWDDPAFAVAWPDAPARVMSSRDASYPDFIG